jgi:Zn-dependent protease
LDFQSLFIVVPVLLFSVIAHEYAHGYAALRQGDTTAYMLGRLTWNPIKHIDPIYTIAMPLMLYVATQGQMMLGGAKPVPVDPRNYRNYRRGDIIVSLAGVFTNLLIALICAAAVPLLGIIGRAAPGASPALGFVQAMMMYAIFLNFVLIVFNLIPIPPLDGSHVLKHLLPASLARPYEQISRYGFLVLIAVLWFGSKAISVIMAPAFIASAFMFELLHSWMLVDGMDWFRRVLSR